jgi:hypothetical protein
VGTTLGVATRAEPGMGDKEQHKTKVKYNQVVMDSPILLSDSHILGQYTTMQKCN